MGKIVGSVVFPGLGHLLSGRYLKGALLGVLFALTAEVLLGSVVWPEAFAGLRKEFMALAAAIWVYGIIDHGILLARQKAPEKGAPTEQLMLAGMKAMLRGELETAETAFRTVLNLDDRDVEGWLYLARTCQLRGQERRARRFYRVVSRLDRQGKWKWELGRLSGVDFVGSSDTTL